jgi:hypothetical protein
MVLARPLAYEVAFLHALEGRFSVSAYYSAAQVLEHFLVLQGLEIF